MKCRNCGRDGDTRQGLCYDCHKTPKTFPQNIIDNGRPYVIDDTWLHGGNAYAIYQLNDPSLTIDDLRSEPDTFIELSLEEALELEA